MLLKVMKFTSDNVFIASLAMLYIIYVVPIPCSIVQEQLLLIQCPMVYHSHCCLKYWIQVPYMFKWEGFFMEMWFKILLLTKYSFDLPGTGNCIDRMEHFEN